jgi:hypothetical protein
MERKVTFFAVSVPLIGAAMLLAPEADQRRRSERASPVGQPPWDSDQRTAGYSPENRQQ